MSEQTSFDLSDGNSLLSEFKEFYEILWQEWSKVLNQWENLKAVWHDSQLAKFEPFFERLLSIYKEEIRQCESYIDFLSRQIEIGERQRNKLGVLSSLETSITLAQIAISLLGINATPVIQNVVSEPRPNFSYVQGKTPDLCLLDTGLDLKDAERGKRDLEFILLIIKLLLVIGKKGGFNR